MYLWSFPYRNPLCKVVQEKNSRYPGSQKWRPYPSMDCVILVSLWPVACVRPHRHRFQNSLRGRMTQSRVRALSYVVIPRHLIKRFVGRLILPNGFTPASESAVHKCGKFDATFQRTLPLVKYVCSIRESANYAQLLRAESSVQGHTQETTHQRVKSDVDP